MQESTAAGTRKGGGALAGLKVIDLSRVLAGPYSTQILADHGAHVIKIEPPQGDETRGLGPPFVGDVSAYYQGLNRNKLGMALDLSRPEARDVLLRMLEDADILVENFRPGTMQRWGIGYDEVLSTRFPRLIYCRISGFGANGPLSALPGYDAVLQAFCGLMSVNGHAESGPTRIGLPIVDLATGLSSLIGVLLAVVERERSGKGQMVEAALFDVALSLLHPHAVNWFASGDTPTLSGNAHPNISPYDKYAAHGGDVFIGVLNDNQFRKLCHEIGRQDLPADPRFSGNTERIENRQALRIEIEAALADIDATALCEKLMAHGVSAARINSVAEVLDHPHTAARAMTAELGDYRGLGIPLKLSRTPGAVHSAPPSFAADTRSVLADAGFDAAEIERLIGTGVTPLTLRRH